MTPIPAPRPVIRQVTLRTPDATRLAAFYQMLLDLRPQPDPANPRRVSLIDPCSDQALLTLIEDPGAKPAPRHAPGLFHIAFLFTRPEDWRLAVKRALPPAADSWGAADHGVSWACYFADPDGNGIELAWDKPSDQWPWHGDHIRMVTRPLPLRSLLAGSAPPTTPSGGLRIGHLHLRVPDLQLAGTYQDRLGLRITQADYPGALFLARGPYHHHVALNIWHLDAGTPAAGRPPDACGLVGWEMSLPDEIPPFTWTDPIGHHVILT